MKTPIAVLILVISTSAYAQSRRELKNQVQAINDANLRASAAAQKRQTVTAPVGKDASKTIADTLLQQRADTLTIGAKELRKLRVQANDAERPDNSLQRKITAMQNKIASAKAGEFHIPPMAPPIMVGNVGPMPHGQFNVIQVQGPTEFRADIVSYTGSNIEVIVRGVPTGTMRDRSGHTTGTQCFQVTGNASYVTVAGAERTLLVLEPFDTSEAERLFREGLTASATRRKLAPVAKVSSTTSNDGLAGRLSNARTLIKSGLFPAADKYLRKIIADAPGSDAAAEAQKELDKLPAH